MTEAINLPACNEFSGMFLICRYLQAVGGGAASPPFPKRSTEKSET